LYADNDYSYTISDGCAREVVQLVAPAFLAMPYSGTQKTTATGMFSVLPAHMKRWTQDRFAKFLKSENGGNKVNMDALEIERETGKSHGEICWAFDNAVQFAFKSQCLALQGTVNASDARASEMLQNKLT
jgi:hypothetical protein